MTRMNDRVVTLVCVAASAAVFVVCVGNRSGAADAGLSAAGTGRERPQIAVIDVSRVFAEYATFQNEVLTMQDEMATFKTELLALQDKANQIQKEMESLEEGTPEHIEKKAAVAAIGFQFEQRKKAKELDIQERERIVYARAYECLKMAVDMHARQNGIKLVLRFNSEDADLTQRQKLLDAINRPVVYQDGIDITGDIVEMMNHSADRVLTEP